MSRKRKNSIQEVDLPPNKWIHPLACFLFLLRTPGRKREIIWGFLKISLLGFFSIVILAVGIFVYYSRDLPKSSQIAERRVAESTKILDRTGQVLLYEIHGEERRTIVPFDEMPKSIKDATVVAEDDQFYSHHGLDFKAIVRAILADVKHARSQGASTITQQFIKNSVLSPEKTYTRKFKEALLSIELERRFSKNEILEMYLNEIPYGVNAYGMKLLLKLILEKKLRL